MKLFHTYSFFSRFSRKRARVFIASVISVTAGLFMLFVYVIPIFAAPPTTPYSPGQTLNPSCSPGDTNCTVRPPVSASGTVAKGSLLVHDGISSSSVWSLLATSTNGRVLTASSGATYGLAWQGFATSGPALSISYDSTTHTFSLPTSTASVTGVLTGTDWTTFNNKQSAITLSSSTNQGSFYISSSSNEWTFNFPGRINTIAGLASSTGSLIVGSSTAGWAALSVGSNGNVLTASSTAANGLSWESVASSQWTTSGNDIYYTTGKIAIGTTTPATLFHIASTSPIISLTDDDNLKQYRLRLGETAANAFDIYDFSSSTSRLTITGAGNVGIGTTTPNSKLAVYGSSGTVQVVAESNSDYIAFFSNDTFGPAIHWKGVGQGDLRIGPSTDINGGGFSETLRITSTGKIAIGTTTPAHLLHLVGVSSTLALESSATGGKRYVLRSGGISTATSSFDIYDNASTTSRLTITGDGNVGIGTSTPISTTALHVVSTAAANSGLVVQGAASQSGNLQEWKDNSGNILANILLGGGAIFNENAQNSDFRIEGTTDGNLLRVDTDDNSIGIGSGSGAFRTKLQIGDSSGNQLGIDSSSGGLDDTAGISFGFSGGASTALADIQAIVEAASTVGFRVRTSNTGADNQTERFRITGGGLVAIGTTTPATLLHIASTSPIISFTDNDNLKQYRLRLGESAANAFDIYDFSSSTSRLTITGAGNVGIGTSTPANPLTIYSATVSGGQLRIISPTTNDDVGIGFSDLSDSSSQRWVIGKNVGGTGDDAFNFYYNGTRAVINTSGQVLGSGGGASTPAFSFTTDTDTGLFSFADNTIGFYTGGAFKGGFNGSNLAIGTTTPAHLLHIVGVSSTLALESSATGGKRYVLRSGGISTATSSFDIYDNASTTSRLTITGDGNVGIGTTTPQYMLDVAGNARLGSGAEAMRITTSSRVGIATTTPAYRLVVGDGTTQSDVYIPKGGLCVDNDASGCPTAPNQGQIYASSTSVTGIDVAENYPIGDDSLEAGDVVSIEGSLPERVIKADSGNVSKMIGIVSTAPGVLLGRKATSSVPVALVGRVPVKINAEGGDINIGDALTASESPGIAKRAKGSGRIIGYALSAYSSSTEATLTDSTGLPQTPKILVFVNNSYWFETETALEDGSTGSGFLATIISSLKDFGITLERGIVRAKEFIAEKIIAKRVVTQEFEIKDSATGDTYCVRIEYGEWVKTLGGCDDNNANIQMNANAPNSANIGTADSENNVNESGVNTSEEESASIEEPTDDAVTEDTDEEANDSGTISDVEQNTGTDTSGNDDAIESGPEAEPSPEPTQEPEPEPIPEPTPEPEPLVPSETDEEPAPAPVE